MTTLSTLSIIQERHLRWFIEYAETVPNSTITFEVPASVTSLTDTSVLIYCDPPKPAQIEHLRDDQVFFVNTEQMTRLDLRDRFLRELRELARPSITVIDYSASQTAFWRSLGFQAIHMPYKSPPAEASLLRSLLAENTAKTFDVGHCGHMMPRRRSVLQELANRGLRVIDVKLWGLERDRVIAQCKCLLNIHQQDDCHVFETVRCSRWMEAGLPIVSEDGIDTPEESEIFKVAKHEDLVSVTIDFLRSLQ